MTKIHFMLYFEYKDCKEFLKQYFHLLKIPKINSFNFIILLLFSFLSTFFFLKMIINKFHTNYKNLSRKKTENLNIIAIL
jgi:TRAP-type C4-dicarboxylate transport system permease small subunit